MDRIRKYLGRELDPSRLTDFEEFGARPRWVPDRIEAFDEIELAFPFTDDEDLCLTIALEEGRMARILLSAARAGDDDADARGLSEEELKFALGRHGDTMTQLLEHMTAFHQR
jgi:hypothetical protein